MNDMAASFIDDVVSPRSVKMRSMRDCCVRVSSIWLCMRVCRSGKSVSRSTCRVSSVSACDSIACALRSPVTNMLFSVSLAIVGMCISIAAAPNRSARVISQYADARWRVPVR